MKIEQAIQEEVSGNQAYWTAQATLANKKSSGKERKEAQQKMRDIEASARSKYAPYINDYKKQASALNKRMDSTAGAEGASDSPSGGKFKSGSLKVN